MPSPFPGMDPYLEDPTSWQSFHTTLIVVFQELLNPLIKPKYVARVEDRVYMDEDDPRRTFVSIPDVRIESRKTKHGESQLANAHSSAITAPIRLQGRDPIRQRRIEILEASSHNVVTLIELLSPSNKRKGAEGRSKFVRKRKEILRSKANWVEIDLLRKGVSHSHFPRGAEVSYLVFSSPVRIRPDSEIWPIRLQDCLPVIGIPLGHPDPAVPLDLQNALTMAYDRAAFDVTIDYTQPPNPPLSPEQSVWAQEQLRASTAR